VVPEDSLSDQEIAILQLLGDGSTVKEIAVGEDAPQADLRETKRARARA
jgi:hypothetical protein